MDKFRKFLYFIEWASPIVKLFTNTTSAISNGYDEKLIKDPGHDRIKIYDGLIIIFTWGVAAIIIVPSISYYKDINDDLLVLMIIFFPYFTNVYVAILLYINTIILSIYNKNRQNIIRRINEKKGVW